MSANATASGQGQGAWSAIFLVYAIGVFGAMTVSQVIPVSGDIARQFHTGAQIGWIISAPSALVAVGALLVGWLVDRIGDKTVLLAGAAIVVLGDLGVAHSDTLRSLLAMRVIEGVGYVCIAVAAITMLTRITHGPRRNLALTLWSSFIPMSFAIPLLLASKLVGAEHWRWAFNGHAIIQGALLALGIAQLPARGVAQAAPSRVAGLATVLRTPAAYLLGLCFACAAFVQTGIVSTLPHLLASRYAVGIGAASSVGTLGMALNTAGCLIVGPLLNRGVRPIAVAVAGVSCTISGGLLLGAALPSFALAIAVSCLFFTGAGIIVGLWALLPQAAPNRQSLGAASGLVTQLTLWGVLFGPPAAFAAQAAGGWLREGRNIVLAGLTIIVCIWFVVYRFARAGEMHAAPTRAVTNG